MGGKHERQSVNHRAVSQLEFTLRAKMGNGPVLKLGGFDNHYKKLKKEAFSDLL